MRKSSRPTPVAEPASVDTAEPALPAGLVYVSDDRPGYTRTSQGDGYAYHDCDGRTIDDPETLARIRKLAVPPAYRDVWICPLPNGHLQATGRDARDRKQYRYHADWRAGRDADKFGRMEAFGRALPRIRARVARDLRAAGSQSLSRELLLATLVRLLDTTCVRVGNDEYTRDNGSFGLTTLRNRHAGVKGSVLRLSFRGKSGVSHTVTLDDPQVARVVRRCQQLPGQELFRWVDAGGATRSIDSADVNDYLCAAAGERYTAKDFRTWHGSVQALELTRQALADPHCRQAPLKQVLAEVARRLGNTAAVCRKSYIHPAVLARAALRPSAAAALVLAAGSAPRGLQAAERRLLAFLHALREEPPTAAAVLAVEPIVLPRRVRREGEPPPLAAVHAAAARRIEPAARA